MATSILLLPALPGSYVDGSSAPNQSEENLLSTGLEAVSWAVWKFPVSQATSDIELIGALNSVLKGPAHSWWVATRSTTTYWDDFKKAFFEAFLLTDYEAEIEEQLRTMVQAPTQCLRDYSYDYRALCLKWRPDMPEDEVMRLILSTCDPRLASGMLTHVVKVKVLYWSNTAYSEIWSLQAFPEKQWAAKVQCLETNPRFWASTLVKGTDWR